MITAISVAHEQIKKVCAAIAEFGSKIGITKYRDSLVPSPPSINERVEEVMMGEVDSAFGISNKASQSDKISEAYDKVVEKLQDDFPEQEAELKKALKRLFAKRMYEIARDEGRRVDGRGMKDVRPIDIMTGFLPKVHGSAVFTRGETQTIATTTLGDKGMAQKMDTISGVTNKKFYLQYTFPPSCVGETGRVGAPGRREVGHGNLAERALLPAIPSEEDFPYTIRLESLITESHGSSSMASVCGGCLSMMDAGVPIKEAVAGIAMGALMESSEDDIDSAIVLTDLMGLEDALGMMDFKIAGSRRGITTFQLDTKCEGLSLSFMDKALEQAKVARLSILDVMDSLGPGVREELPETVPKVRTFKIQKASIGKVIGPGGKQIRSIIEDFDLSNMDVGEEGEIQVSGYNATALADVEKFVSNLVSDSGGGRRGGPGRERQEKKKYSGPQPSEGEVYTGRITGVHNWGVFLEIMPGLEGLCHVSELHTERVRNCEGFVASLGVEEFEVMYLGKNDRGQLQLSRKAVLSGGRSNSNSSRRGGGRGRAGSSSSGGGGEPPATVQMSAEEAAVIESAINAVGEL